MNELRRAFEAATMLRATPWDVFEYLDDHGRLAAHMERRSLMTVGSRMRIEMDAQRGRAVGSIIRLSGRVLGVRVHVEEAVTERVPPFWKEWGTTSPPRLLVIGQYRMGFSISEAEGGSFLRVFIRYDLPSGAGGWLRGMLAGWYARWCVMRMLDDAKSSVGPGTEAQCAASVGTGNHEAATREDR